MRSTGLIILIVILLLVYFPIHPVQGSTSPVAVYSAPSPDWSQYQADAAHDGFTSSIGPSLGGLVWQISVGGTDDGIVATDGQIIVGGNGLIWAYNSTNDQPSVLYGPRNWDSFSKGPTTTYVACGGGEAYFEGNYNWGHFYGLAADYVSNGNEVWSAATTSPGSDSQQSGGMPTYDNGTVYYAGVMTNQVYSFNSVTGTQEWTSTAIGDISSNPTVGQGLVILTFTNIPAVEALGAGTGNEMWNFTTDGLVSGSSSYGNGMFYLGTENGTLYAVSPHGQLQWKDNLNGAIESTPAQTNEQLFVSTAAGELYAINLTNGVLEWRFNDSSLIIASPAISGNGIVYIADSSGFIYAFNALTGKMLWSYNIGIPITTSLVIYNDYLYAVDTSGNLYAFANKYIVTFNEDGLPSGTSWNINMSSINETSQTNSIQFLVQNGSYSYKVGETIGYSASPSSGTVTVNGRNQNISISFSQGWSLPSAPQSLKATGSLGQIVLTWNVPNNNGAPPGYTGSGIESYYIYRNTTPGQETYYGKVNGSQLSFVDSSVNSGTIYFYTVSAVNPIGQSGFSNEASAEPVTITDPSPPQNLTALSVSSKGVELSWNSPSSNGGSPITEYVIYRYTSDQSAVAIGNILPNTTTYLDSSAHAGGTYYYYVVAINRAGTSNPSNTLTFVAPNNFSHLPWYEVGFWAAIGGLGTFILIVLGILSVVTLVAIERRRRSRGK